MELSPPPKSRPLAAPPPPAASIPMRNELAKAGSTAHTQKPRRHGKPPSAALRRAVPVPNGDLPPAALAKLLLKQPPAVLAKTLSLADVQEQTAVAAAITGSLPSVSEGSPCGRARRLGRRWVGLVRV